MYGSMYLLLKTIKEAQHIVIAGHISPDADAIGACFALAHALANIGKTVRVVMDDYSDKYTVLPGWEFVITSEQAYHELHDLFIALDCGDISRVGDANTPLFRRSTSIVIDHHVHVNEGFGHINIIDTNASATCEILFEVIKTLTPITREIAMCLYAGILTDTGGFRFRATSPKTMNIVSQLLTHDFDFSDLYEKLMFEQTFHQFQGFMSVVNDYTYDHELDFVYTIATRDKLNSLGITKNDLDGIVNFFKRIKEMQVAALAYELAPGKTKISLRSHRFNVNQIAAYFGGGGHKLASACQFDLPPDQAIEQIKDKLRELTCTNSLDS